MFTARQCSDRKARIALLEGQRKSAENLKVDLLKRVKLLEYALRTERSVFAPSGAQARDSLADHRRVRGAALSAALLLFLQADLLLCRTRMRGVVARKKEVAARLQTKVSSHSRS